MKNRLFALVFLALVSSSAVAADRIEKVRTLMEASGMIETYEQQLAYSRVRCRQQAEQMYQQVIDGLNPPAEYAEKIQKVASKFIDDMMPAWTATEIVDVLAKIYGEKFSDEELDGLISFSLSPLGKKSIQATREALPEFSKHFEELQRPITEKATADYVKNLQAVVEECNCTKANAAARKESAQTTGVGKKNKTSSR